MAFALVLSQDGAASLIRRVGDVVLVLRPLQLGAEDEGIPFGEQIPSYTETSDPREFLDYASLGVSF